MYSKCLDNFCIIFQIAALKDQLGHEMRRRMDGSHYESTLKLNHFDSTGDIRQVLDSSLTRVTRDPLLDSALLEAEAKRLDDSIYYSGCRDQSPTRRKRLEMSKKSATPATQGRRTTAGRRK